MSDNSVLGTKRDTRDEDEDEDEDEDDEILVKKRKRQRTRQCDPVQKCVSILKKSRLTRAKKNMLCQTLHNLSEYTQKSVFEKMKNNVGDISIYFIQFLHIWFTDSVIIEEILKMFKSKKVQILESIYFREAIDSDFNNLNSKNLLQTIEGVGTGVILEGHTHPFRNFDLDSYKSKIREGGVKLYVTPFATSFKKIHPVPGEDPHDHHMTITVFDCDKNTLEFFNPGLTNHEKSIKIVEQTMNKVFQNVYHYKTDIKFVDVGETCPFVGKIHIPLNNTPFWDNTCSTFSLWYMFERILFPDKDYVTILNDIKRSLGDRFYAEGRIRTIILTFLSLVNINIETCEVKSADGERTRESELLRSLKKNGGSRRKKNCNRKKTIRQRSKKIK